MKIKIVLLVITILSLSFGQQLRFTGTAINIGNGKTFSGEFIQGTAGDTLVFGELCYLKSDNKFYKANPSTAGHFTSLLGIVAEDTLNTDNVGRFLVKGFIKDTSYSYTAGDMLFADTARYTDSYFISGAEINANIGFVVDSVTIFIDTDWEGYYWDDLRFPVSTLRLPASNPPTATNYLGSQVLAFPTNADASIYFIVQMPHSWITGTDIDPHIHYTLSTNGTNPDSVRWVFTYSWVGINGQFPTQTTVNKTDIVTSKVDSTHYLLDLGSIDASGITGVSSMIICSLTRDVSEDDYGGSIYLLEIDIHYLSDAKGSRQEYIK